MVAFFVIELCLKEINLICHKRIVLLAISLLHGEKNGKRIGMK